MRLIFPMLAICASVAISGCDSKSNGTDTAVTINASIDNSSNKTGDAGGAVAVKVPGFDANIKLPAGMLGDTNFDIDGVKLYPGSKVHALNVNADTAASAKAATVRIGFDAPADSATVRAWFLKSFAEKSVRAGEHGTGVAGTTRDGDSFEIMLTPEPGGRTSGEVAIVDKKG